MSSTAFVKPWRWVLEILVGLQSRDPRATNCTIPVSVLLDLFDAIVVSFADVNSVAMYLIPTTATHHQQYARATSVLPFALQRRVLDALLLRLTVEIHQNGEERETKAMLAQVQQRSKVIVQSLALQADIRALMVDSTPAAGGLTVLLQDPLSLNRLRSNRRLLSPKLLP